MTPEQRKAKIEKLLKQNLKAEEVHCDCPVYSSTPKVCQHALAAAEDMGILSHYLTFLRKTKAVALNLSTLISKELPKSAGRKNSTFRRKGAPKSTKKPVPSQKMHCPYLVLVVMSLLLKIYHQSHVSFYHQSQVLFLQCYHPKCLPFHHLLCMVIIRVTFTLTSLFNHPV